jgi:hypothetical protein
VVDFRFTQTHIPAEARVAPEKPIIRSVCLTSKPDNTADGVMLTQERVRELFDYREDGCLIRKVRCGPSMAGSLVVNQLRIDNKKYLLHRIIFLWHQGFLPKEVDHSDRNPNNNRIKNLRAATHTQNQANSKIHKHSKSKLKGVSFDKKRNKWRAQISINGKTKFLGRFETKEFAHDVYVAYAKLLHGEFCNPG